MSKEKSLSSKANVIDLTSVFSRPVANQNSDPLFDLDTDEVIEEAVFDVEPEPEQSREQQQAEPVSGTFASPKDIAENLVNLIDGLQSTAVPFFREIKVFTGKEREMLQNMDTTGNTVFGTNSPESALLRKWLKHQKLMEKVPFSPGESRRLINSTARYVETVNMQLTPLQALALSFSEVVMKRSAMFFTD